MMRCVTASTHCSDDKPLLEQSFSVDALTVVDQDAVLMDGVGQLYFRTFVMTSTAECGNVHHAGWRLRISAAMNVMRAVACLACGCERIAALDRSPVETFVVLICYIVMAVRALYRGQILLVGVLPFG